MNDTISQKHYVYFLCLSFCQSKLHIAKLMSHSTKDAKTKFSIQKYSLFLQKMQKANTMLSVSSANGLLVLPSGGTMVCKKLVLSEEVVSTVISLSVSYDIPSAAFSYF